MVKSTQYKQLIIWKLLSDLNPANIYYFNIKFDDRGLIVYRFEPIYQMRSNHRRGMSLNGYYFYQI